MTLFMQRTELFTYFFFSKRRRRVNLLITTFLPVDGKAEGSITCRGEQEDRGENYERKIKGGGDESGKEVQRKE